MKIIIVIIFFCLGSILKSQNIFIPQNDTIANTNKHIEKYKEFSEAIINAKTYSSLKNQQNLQSNTEFYIKNYGDGQLSTIQFRGFSAQHNDVEWKGIPLNSGFNGTVDLSNIPFPLGKSISSFRNLGKSISIQTDENITDHKIAKHEISMNIRLYNMYNAKYHFIKKYHSNLIQIDLDIKKGINNFNYFDNGQYKNISHNNYEQFSFILNLTNKNNKKGITRSTSVWITSTEREIPPTLSSNVSFQKLRDKTFRFSFESQRKKFTNNVFIELNQNIYNDDAINLVGTYNNQSLKNKFSYNLYNNIFELQFISLQSIERLQSNNYNQIKLLFNSVNQLQLSKQFKYHNLSATITSIQQNGKFIIPLPGLVYRYSKQYLGMQLLCQQEFHVKSKFANGNDLYWMNSGNLNLKSELSYQSENKSTLHFSLKKFQLGIQLKSFIYYSKNLIYWIPQQNGLWGPTNLSTVLSYGINPSIQLFYKENIKLISSYQFNPVYNIDEQNKDLHLKNLIYSPVHKISNTIEYHYKILSTSITHIYTSERFYNSDNSNWLPPYQLWNASVSFTLKSIVLGIKCENILNASYQEIANRAMPGILPSINFKFQFHE